MHELSICGSIADIVARHADGRRVETIHVRVGQLRQIVPDTLTYCWTLVCSDGSLAGSRLEVERVPAAIRCRRCGGTSELGPSPAFACSSCHGTDIEVVAGEEFLITSLDLAEA
ncbi:MAG: hydrogenase maturation nickel metallochaperone HypA [Actinomycetes bacterium]